MNRYRPEGTLIATHENREALSSLNGLEKDMQSGRILEGLAVMCDESLNITVDLCGIKGVIPKKEALYSDEEIKDIAVITRVGKAVCFKVMGIEKDSDGRNVAILSRRAAQIECMQNYILSLRSGDIIDARVTHLEQFGAFVDIGCGIVSLLSIDCISVSRISHPRDRFNVGMPIKTVVKSIDYDTGRVYVTHKELLGTWEENSELFSVGQTVAGVIRSIEDYGVFVELMPNLAGLAELRDDLGKNPSPGQCVAVYIKNIIPEKMKIKLVLVDVSGEESAPRQLKYFIDPKTLHISKWRYSPEISNKNIETMFE